MAIGSDFLFSGGMSDKLLALMEAKRLAKVQDWQRQEEERKKAAEQQDEAETKSRVAGAAQMGISGAMLGGSLGYGVPGAVVGGLLGAGLGAFIGGGTSVAPSAMQAAQMYKQGQPVKGTGQEMMRKSGSINTKLDTGTNYTPTISPATMSSQGTLQQPSRSYESPEEAQWRRERAIRLGMGAMDI